MGTVFVFPIADKISPTEATRLCEAASEVLVDADEQFSLYKPDSEISKLNDSRLAWDNASRIQRSIKKQTEDWKAQTAGFFDAVSPNGVYEPSGLVKSWAARNAAGYLEANGIRYFTLNAGGDVYLGPEVTPGILSRVGLSNLKSISAADAAVNMILDLAGSDFRAIATSGSSERGEHIWRNNNEKALGFKRSSQRTLAKIGWVRVSHSSILQKNQTERNPGRFRGASQLEILKDETVRTNL